VSNECSIALLPMHNLSRSVEDEPLCAGITGDIIHNLTRFRDVTVIAQHSGLQARALALAPSQIAEKLGVRYLLMGDLRRDGDRLELRARLLETESEHVIWSARYDGLLGDVFAFQDEVIDVITANLAAEIRAAAWRRAVDLAPAELSAYGLLLRGQYLTHRYQRAANLEARFLFERARQLDPGYAKSYASLSRTFNMDWRYTWSDDPGGSLDGALELAELAVQCDPLDACAHAEVGFVCLYRKQHQASLIAYERAIELNPNDPDILAEMGDALTNAGQLDRARQLLTRAISLNPFCPDWYLRFLGEHHFYEGDYPQTIDTLKKMRDLSEAHRMLAASYAHLDKIDEARHHAAQLMKVHPNFSIDHWSTIPPYKDQEPIERLVDGLRKAGLR
jgi:adenylate cyclase